MALSNETELTPLQSMNADVPMLVKVDGRIAELNREQFLKHSLPMDVILDDAKSICIKEKQSLKAELPIATFTELNAYAEYPSPDLAPFKRLHPLNASLPMETVIEGIFTWTNNRQPAKTESGMEVKV